MKRSAKREQTPNPKRNTLSSSSSSKELITHVLTRKIGDTSNDDDINNWKEIKLILVPSESTPSVETYICNMDTFQYDEEKEIRLCFSFENFSDKKYLAKAMLDGKQIILEKALRQGRTSVCHTRIGNYTQNISIRRNGLANDESEVAKEEDLNGIGSIEFKLFSVLHERRGQMSSFQPTVLTSNELKIKESMTKKHAYAVNFGQQIYNPVQNNNWVTCGIGELFKTINIRYYSYLGFLLELSKHGIVYEPPEEEKEEETREQPKVREVIEIEDDDEEEPTITNNLPVNIPNPKPYSPPNLLKNVKIGQSEVSKMDTEQLLKWIKLVDEHLYKDISTSFTTEGIDGSTFLSLTQDEMKLIQMSIKNIIKVKQILQLLNK